MTRVTAWTEKQTQEEISKAISIIKTQYIEYF